RRLFTDATRPVPSNESDWQPRWALTSRRLPGITLPRSITCMATAPSSAGVREVRISAQVLHYLALYGGLYARAANCSKARADGRGDRGALHFRDVVRCYELQGHPTAVGQVRASR